ncbi:hypothetical protein BHQ17_16935 [Mycolicibacterium holsaticum]|uniref:Uncharacterized protein n=1 Tax=Mycolicibacterium holsaticum TaxID=152142 RepID=A0A1E3RM86_9MYCO|nr:hypothetical protein BHQ17_16935 [Mycolicibacterium holsaticum]
MTRSAAASTISSQAALAQNDWQGRLRSPVALSSRMRSSTRAWGVVPQFQAGDLYSNDTGFGVGDERAYPHAVGVGEPQLCTGVGAFFTQNESGVGRPATEVTRSVASATQAPSRIPPSVSIAGYRAWPRLRVSRASWTRASTG